VHLRAVLAADPTHLQVVAPHQRQRLMQKHTHPGMQASTREFFLSKKIARCSVPSVLTERKAVEVGEKWGDRKVRCLNW
jgi:hypothetical protein